MRILPKRVRKWPVVLAMTVTGVLTMVGCGGSSSTSSNVTATPTFSPGGGTYTITQSVNISDTTPDAVLYCTTDGTTPTASSPQCGLPTTVVKSEFLQAIAVAPGKAASQVASAGYTINLSAAPSPDFSPAGGTYLSQQSVTISDAIAGANLYYTLDGTMPTASSTLYTAPITIAATQTLKAIAVAANFDNSGVSSATYTIAPVATAPTFSIAGGTYTTPQQVGFSDTTSGATIYYTTDGTTPTTSSSVYSGAPIPVSKSVTINAIAVAKGYTNSAVSSATYVINLAPAPSPTFSLTLASLSINEAATGATIYYTTDGTTPITSSAVYGGPITVTQGEVVQAIAAGADYLNSTPSSYVVNFPIASTPTFALSLVTLTITDATTGATIHYTTDGSTPTVASSVYGGPITVTEGEVVNAIAAGPGLVSSSVGMDTIAFAPTPEPTFSPADGLSSTVPLTITLSDASGATIYYTLDGTTPTTGSTVYSAPFTISSTTTVKALGTALGFANSSVASATYTIAPGNTALSGHVLTGATPVKGATVQLYAAGLSGYGSSGATLLAQALTADKNGAFSFTFNCPAAPGDLVYLVATGGDSGNGPNSSIALMSALGSCNGASFPKSVTANEVTTIASAYALSAFATFGTSGGITVGAPTTGPSCNAAAGWLSTQPESCNYTGLSNAFQAVQNLVNVTGSADAFATAAGAARTHTPAYSTDFSGDPNILNNSTVPTTRIDALADMLASCVESNGSGCGSGLFAAAATSDSTTGSTPFTPGDTLQAALNIAQNPGNNVSGLLGLVSSMATLPYSLTSPDPGSSPLDVTNDGKAPVDLTLALTFTGAGLGGTPTTTLSDGSSMIVNAALAIDPAGNVWIGASRFYIFGTDGTQIAEFNALGAPVTPATTLTSYGGYNPNPGRSGPNYLLESSISSLVIDQSGNLWTDDDNGNAVEISTIPSLPATPKSISAGEVQNLTIDSGGDAWIINGNGPAVLEILGNGNPGVTGANLFGYGLSNLAFDSGGALWAAGNGIPVNGISSTDIYQLSTSGSTPGSIVYDAFPTAATNPTGPVNVPTTLAAGSSGNIYGCDPTGKFLDEFNTNTQTPGNLMVNSYSIAETQRGCGTQLVIDGQRHIFAVLNNGFGTFLNPNFIGNIDEYTAGGALISSPANGYTGSSSTEAPTLNPDSNDYPNPSSGIGAAIDGSGDLWVLNTDTYGTNPVSFSPQPGNVLVEYIGIGAPVVTPASTALTNNMLGARP